MPNLITNDQYDLSPTVPNNLENLEKLVQTAIDNNKLMLKLVKEIKENLTISLN